MPSLDSRGPRIPAAGYAVGDTGPCRVAVVQSMPSSLLRGSTHAADGHQLLGNRGLTFPAECTGRHPPDLLDPWIGPTWVLLPSRSADGSRDQPIQRAALRKRSADREGAFTLQNEPPSFLITHRPAEATQLPHQARKFGLYRYWTGLRFGHSARLGHQTGM